MADKPKNGLVFPFMIDGSLNITEVKHFDEKGTQEERANKARADAGKYDKQLTAKYEKLDKQGKVKTATPLSKVDDIEMEERGALSDEHYADMTLTIHNGKSKQKDILITPLEADDRSKLRQEFIKILNEKPKDSFFSQSQILNNINTVTLDVVGSKRIAYTDKNNDEKDEYKGTIKIGDINKDNVIIRPRSSELNVSAEDTRSTVVDKLALTEGTYGMHLAPGKPAQIATVVKELLSDPKFLVLEVTAQDKYALRDKQLEGKGITDPKEKSIAQNYLESSDQLLSKRTVEQAKDSNKPAPAAGEALEATRKGK